MKLKIQPPNNIQALCEKRGMSACELAKRVGTSAPHISRLINGRSPIKDKWLLKISAALKVPTSEITGVKLDKKFKETCDDTLLGSIMGWLIEANEKSSTNLSAQQLGRLSSFIYKETVETPLNGDQAYHLALMVIKIKQLVEG
jgi:transcriptional regulator with XRE-family HTH domain